MINRTFFWRALFIIFVIYILFLSFNSSSFSWLRSLLKSKKIQTRPSIILWAWEKEEDLTFLKDKNTGVAFYAGSVIFQKEKINTKPRLQPLLVNSFTPLIAVVRIDNLNKDEGLLTEKHLKEMGDFIIHTCLQYNVSGCQIDFDAKFSEQNFYKKFLKEVRNKLPNVISLSITALASWCNQGSWLESLPIKEAVPMFYQLGPDTYLIKNNLTSRQFMQAKQCQSSIGISLDESLPPLKYLKNKQVYIFNSSHWTIADFKEIAQKIQKIQNL